MPEYEVTQDNIHIVNSYKITSRSEMKKILNCIKLSTIAINCKVFKQRTINSLIQEWCAHNLCYNLGLFRSHTADVDLNLETKAMQKIYAIVSLFYT